MRLEVIVLTTIFFICLGVGAGFIILSMALGQVFGASSMNFDSGGASPFRVIFIALFLTTFGGLGLIFYPVVGSGLALIVGGFGGLFLAFLMAKFILMPLMRWQNTTTHEKQAVIGMTAKVAETIVKDGFGKITYTVNDKIVSGPAKSENGTLIERGTEVEIMYIERGNYFVKQKEIIKLIPN